MNRFALRSDGKVAGRLQITCEWVWVGVRLIIEYPCAAPPNIKRALIRASVDTRNVCGPIGRPWNIVIAARAAISGNVSYVRTMHPAEWPIRECSITYSL